MTVRSLFLAVLAGMCLSRECPAQLAAPPPVRTIEVEQAPRLRQTHEDMAVFRVLLNRAVSRYYNFPAGHADLAHAPPSAEGVYLKGQGVIYTAGLPGPPTHPVHKAAAGPADPSAWERARLELRGEKPAAEPKPADSLRKSLSEMLLALLAENGQHFSQLAPEERVTIALTLRPGQECTRCHTAATERYITLPRHILGLTTRLEPPKPGLTSAPPQPMYGAGAPLTGLPGMSGSEEGHNDIQLGDLALKQGRHVEAETAYTRALRKLQDIKGVESDLRTLVLLAEISSKLAQCALAAGQGDRAKIAMERAQKFAQLAVTFADKRGTGKTSPLPAQLILSATKAQLDQVAGRKISFEEFTKAASIEYRTFDAPGSPEEKK